MESLTQHDDDEITAARAAKAAKETLTPLSLTGDTWPSPIQLKSTLSPVPQLARVMLPTSLRSWIWDIAERMQCPPDFAAGAALVVAGSLIGRKLAIYPKQEDSWHEFPNLWGMIVGRPGVMKSPSLFSAMEAVNQLQKNASEAYKDTARDYEAEKIIRELKRGQAKKNARAALEKGEMVDAHDLLTEGEEETTPLRRYTVNNASIEALAEVLLPGPPGLLIYQDELTGLFAKLDKTGNEELKPFLLQGWNGKEGYRVDRIGRGLNRYTPPFALSVLGGIQPGKITRYFKAAVHGTSQDDGFIQRFSILIWPDISPKWESIDRPPDHSAKEKAFQAFANLDAITAPAEGEPARALRFSAEAAPLFRDWHASLEHRLRNESECAAMESHLSKYRKLVPALALIFALLEETEADSILDVGKEPLEMAIAWAVYLEAHARRAYGTISRPDTEAAQRILKEIASGKLPTEGFTARDIQRKGWHGLTTKEECTEALNVLVDHEWIKITPANAPINGRPALPTYTPRPDLKNYQSARKAN